MLLLTNIKIIINNDQSSSSPFITSLSWTSRDSGSSSGGGIVIYVAKSDSSFTMNVG